MFIKAFMNFLSKADFDVENPNMDLYSFHPQIRIFLVFNGIFFNNKDSYLRYLWPIPSALLTMIACCFELMFIYHGYDIKDYSFATECFSYFLIIGTVPIVYASVLFNRNRIVNLLDNMNTDFVYICNLGSTYKDTFLRGQFLIWKLCIIWFIFILSIMTVYIISTLSTLLYQSLFATQNEYMIRPLIFPMWLPEDDPYRTPNYEIFLFIELLFCVIVPQTFCVYIYLLFHFLLHYYYLMSIIILDFAVLFDGLDETVAVLPEVNNRRVQVQTTINSRMRRIVEWHISVSKSVADVSSIYGPPLVYQVMFSSIVICLMAYQVAESLDHGKLNYRFILLCIAACVQLWIPCYLGTLIRNKAFSVGDACWNCGWHETLLGRLAHRDIINVILRAQQPISIKFIGLPNLELETFSSIMSTSYSYFNLLRQYK